MYYSNLNSSLNYVNKPPLADWNPWIWRLIAAGSGVLCGLAQLYPFFAWLVWLAPAGFLFSMLVAPKKRLGEYLWRSGLFAACYYAVAMLGMLQVADYINLPRWQAGLMVLLLCALCVVLLSLPWLLIALIFGLCRPPVAISFAFWPLACYLIEWLQGHFLGGFPVISLGVSQGVWPLLCQSAACWGVCGLSALIILINVLLAAALHCRRWRYLLLAIAVFTVNIAAGAVDWRFGSTTSQTLQTAVAHSDINIEQRWGGSYDAELFAIYAGQAAKAKAAGAQLILLPEGALPYVLQADSGFGARYLQLARQNQITLAVGGFANHADGQTNSLFTATPGGSFTEIYSKRALVPFGEYVPLQGFLDKLLPQDFWDSFPFGNLQPGGRQGAAHIVLPDKSRLAAASLICYDVCFADYPRQAVQEGALVLLAASNDVWYRQTSIVYQHLNHSVLRAIEYNRPLLHSTNGGYSSIIDSQGRILAQTKPNETAAAIAEIEMPDSLTLFCRVGQYQVIPVLLLWLAVSVVGWFCRPAYDYKIFSNR